MKRPKHEALTLADITRLEKEAAAVQAMQTKIDILLQKIYEAKQENNWLNYLGEKSCSLLSDSESMRLCEAHNIINNAKCNCVI